MSKTKNFIKYLFFLVIGMVVFYFVFKDLGIDKIKSDIKNLKWGWVILSFIFALFSHLSRAIRWNMLIKPLGHSPKLSNTFAAVMVMYLTNLVIPRGGELARCSLLTKYEKIPFTKLAGTVVVERSMDMLLLFLLVVTTLFFQIPLFKSFLANNPEFGSKLNILLSPWPWIILIIFLGSSLFIAFRYKNKLAEFKIAQKLWQLLQGLWDGILSIKNMEKKGWFIAHSLFIYLMYFLMMYVVFFSYQATEQASIICGLTAFIMGGLGMLAPVQGGIGAWHFMVIETLVLYGIPKPNGQIFALLSHTSMNFLILIIGLACFLALPLINKKTIE